MQCFMAKDENGNVRQVLANSKRDAQMWFLRMGFYASWGDIAVKKSKKDCGV